ncbi:AI-2E family transporter [Candidatus Saccharibacteria bacterium]|nr:AI-2E family transporter [Candidatus Saccharibacteria bacterium]
MSDTTKIQVTISNRTVLRVIFIVIATLLGLRFILNIAQPLSLIFVAFFLAIAINPVVSYITKKMKMKKRAPAVGIAYLSVVFILVGMFLIIVPPLFDQTRNFIDSLPDTIASVKDQNTALGRFVVTYDLGDEVDNISNEIGKRASNLPEPVISSASKIGSGIVSTIAVLFMTFMMLIEGPTWKKEILKLITPKKRKYYEDMSDKMYDIVTSYVNGQLLISAIAAVFALFGLLIASTLLGVSINAVGLAGIIAITGLIPMIGTLIGATIVVSVSLLSSLPLAIIMLAFFIVYQQIENVTIQPYIQSKKSELTPLLVFIAAILGIGFGGLLGAFIAIPVAACLRIVIIDYYQRKIANKPD